MPPTKGVIDEVPLSRGSIRFIEVAVLEGPEISVDDAKTCAEGLLLSQVQMEKW